MPSRNTIKQNTPETFYHVYARGASKQAIFLDNQDFGYFTNLFARYLSSVPAKNKVGISYPHYAGKVELLAYCLMGNHFHMLIHQGEKGAMAAFMRSLMTSYSRYFNLKHKRSGSLFESRYKASPVTTDMYLQHITRYIHLNPRYWRRYKHSSLGWYIKGNEPEWLQNEKILALFESRQEYAIFVEDYEANKEALESIKYELANT